MDMDERSGSAGRMPIDLATMYEEVRRLRLESQADRATITALVAEVERLREGLADGQPQVQGRVAASEGGDVAGPSRTAMSRRALLFGGAAAVAGASALELSSAGPAAAAGAMQFGADNNAGAAATSLLSTVATWTWLVRNTGAGAGMVGTASAGNGLQGESSGAIGRAGVRGEGKVNAAGVIGHSATNHGVYGETDAMDACGVAGMGVGFSGTGVRGVAGGANDFGASGVVGSSTSGKGVRGYSEKGVGVYGSTATGVAVEALGGTGIGVLATSDAVEALHLVPVAAALQENHVYTKGAVYVTTAGEVWFCVEDGLPGKWRLLASPSSAGAYVPITPVRVFDSRWSAVPGVDTGLLHFGDVRKVSVADARSAAGAVVGANAVPAGARALTVNLTITATQGSGNLALVPQGVISSTTSSINWTAPGQAMANGLTIPINVSNRQINILCNGTATQAIVDVTGYFLGK